MRALGRALRVDLHRSVCSRPFFVTVALLFTWLVANCGRHLTSQTSRRVLSAAEMLNYTLTGTLSLVELVLAIAAVAYAWSYCHDRSSGFFLQAVERVGLPAYGAARAIAVAVSAFWRQWQPWRRFYCFWQRCVCRSLICMICGMGLPIWTWWHGESLCCTLLSGL